MTDDKDPALVRLFAEDADPAPPPDFARTVERRIAALRRRRAVMVAVGLALSGAAVLAAASLIGPPAALTHADAWMTSPYVMALGAALALLLTAASRVRGRRR